MPLSAQWDALNAGSTATAGIRAQVGMWVNRLGKETTVTVFFPNNPVARESVTRYIATMKSVYVRVAEGRGAAAPPRTVAKA